MNIQITDAALFRRSIDALKDFLPQAQFHISTEGVTIRGMDASHIAFVDYFLSSRDCEEIAVPEECMLGVSTGILAKVLATVGNSAESLTLTHDDDHLLISFTGEGRSGTFQLPLLDIEDDTLEIPNTDYRATVRARSADIAGLLKDLAPLGDKVTLFLAEDGFHVRAEGDVGRGEFVLEPTDDREMLLDGDGEEVSYAMKYLAAMIKNTAALSPNMELAFDGSQPLRIRVTFGKGSHFLAFLAPKIAE
jgi:proliferating cell nuclear antigen